MLVDLRAEEDGDTIYRSLERIVHALAEATAYISPRAVAVDRGEQAEAVDDDAGRALRQTLRFVILREADGWALEPRLDSLRCSSWISCGAKTKAKSSGASSLK